MREGGEGRETERQGGREREKGERKQQLWFRIRIKFKFNHRNLTFDMINRY